MIVEKTTTEHYEVTLFPDVWNIEQGDFMRTRKKRGLKTKPFEKCFCCGHKFLEHEIPVVAKVSKIGNRFICSKCAKEVQE